jgi:hypothetical protein
MVSQEAWEDGPRRSGKSPFGEGNRKAVELQKVSTGAYSKQLIEHFC